MCPPPPPGPGLQNMPPYDVHFFQILSDEVKRSLQLSQRLCNAGSHGNSQVEVQMHLQMSQLLTQINNINGHMQVCHYGVKSYSFRLSVCRKIATIAIHTVHIVYTSHTLHNVHISHILSHSTCCT